MGLELSDMMLVGRVVREVVGEPASQNEQQAGQRQQIDMDEIYPGRMCGRVVSADQRGLETFGLGGCVCAGQTPIGEEPEKRMKQERIPGIC